MRALAIEAVIVPWSPLTPAPEGRVSRTVAIREDQTLEQLHEAFRLAFGWYDAHLYSFWVSGDVWDREAPRYSAPFEREEGDDDALTARTLLADVGLEKGSKLSHLFDYGDEWRLALTVVDVWAAGDAAYPMLVDAVGTPPPQYGEPEDEDCG